MARRFLPLVCVFSVTALAADAVAHHSVAGQFDGAKRTTITGTITKVDWINPHVYIYLNGTPNLGWLLNLKYEDGHEYALAGE